MSTNAENPANGSGACYIRNIAIIAHVDHGKSTLADRFIQLCGALSRREMREQVLDSMELERERGITIKAQCVTLNYQTKLGKNYVFNFIDTPGHVDFSYEVSRSLNACEGAILLVDAAQGVEAQTLANTFQSIEQGVEVLPVLNKIDLPQAEPHRVEEEIRSLIGLPMDHTIHISAKKGTGVSLLLDALIDRIPPPQGKKDSPLQALIIDSWFDAYMGVVSLVRVMEGYMKTGDKITVRSSGASYKVEELGVFTPRRVKRGQLSAGEVGYVMASIKDIHGAPVGDTLVADKTTAALLGFRHVQPRIFAGLFPLDSVQFTAFRDALAKLALNDAALVYTPIQSLALGAGFRLGLLGLLHLDIVRERLTREYGLNLIATAPTVVYRAVLSNGQVVAVDSPDKMPVSYARIEEPMAEVTILCPRKYLGAVLTLCQERRGVHKSFSHQTTQVSVEYEVPMSELMTDFFDSLSSLTSGFASMDYRLGNYKSVQLVKVDILLNGEPVDALARLIHRDNAVSLGRSTVEKLKTMIPRQLFTIAIQAAISGKIIARATLTALRKDVIAKCYGGDVTRKRKLLDKQKEGKKRMKRIGKVDLPPNAFTLLLRQ